MHRFAQRLALKLLNRGSLPGGVPGLGEAVSKAVPPVAAAGGGRPCWIFPFTSPRPPGLPSGPHAPEKSELCPQGARREYSSEPSPNVVLIYPLSNHQTPLS